jgi:predicted metal-dependent hydrolase
VEKGQKLRGTNRTILEGLFNQEDSEFDPMQVIANFKWESESTFRVINKDGFEKMIEISSGDWRIHDSTFVPMKQLLNEDANSLYYHEQYKTKAKSTFERLLRKYQKTFTNRQLSIKTQRGTKDNEYVLQSKMGVLYIMFNYTQYHLKMTQALIKEN